MQHDAIELRPPHSRPSCAHHHAAIIASSPLLFAAQMSTSSPPGPRVVFVQDHLVQFGGAERSLIPMVRAVPQSSILTAFYTPDTCYPEFRSMPMETLPLNGIRPLRHHHRLAFPIMAPAFTAHRVRADVTWCCTSGWAHGVRATGRKVIYFQAPARWLYDRDDYLAGSGHAARLLSGALRRPLEHWDRAMVRTGHRFVTNSRPMSVRLGELYGIDVEVVHLPHSVTVSGPQRPAPGVEPGFFLVPSRLMAYKRIDAVIEAFASLPDHRLVVAGDGPQRERLERLAGSNVTVLGPADDELLRWLYANCAALISAANEPFGITPLEAAAFGKPSLTVGDGGFLDTVVPGSTGEFFADPSPATISRAVLQFQPQEYKRSALVEHADRFSEESFMANVSRIVSEEAAKA
jgi:glycosyltransferase involved in cell wall biosynthesis